MTLRSACTDLRVQGTVPSSVYYVLFPNSIFFNAVTAVVYLYMLADLILEDEVLMTCSSCKAEPLHFALQFGTSLIESCNGYVLAETTQSVVCNLISSSVGT